MRNVYHRKDFGRRQFVSILISGAVLSAAIFSASLPSITQAQAEPTVLITGSNRGIGFEFTRQYAAKGWNVIATARRPDEATELKALAEEYPTISIEQLDVMDHAMIDLLAERYAGTPIDILLNNAGIGGGAESQIFGRFNYETFDRTMATNAIGPMKMAEAFVEHVAASDHKKIMTVSSSQGSITEVDRPGLYFYRASKSALNMMMRNLSLQLKGRGIIVGLVAPGATDTDFMKGVPIPLGKPEDRVRGMIGVIDDFTLENTGDFIEYSTEKLPW